MGDHATEGSVGGSACCGDQLVANNRGAEVITRFWCVGQYSPLISGRIILIKPRYCTTGVTIGVTADDIDLVVVCDRSRRATQTISRHTADSFPGIACNIKSVDIGYSRLLREATGESTNDIDMSIQYNRLEVMHLHRQWCKC